MKSQTTFDTETVKHFTSAGGVEIYQIPVQAFPGLDGLVYVLLFEDASLGPLRILVDTGSGFGDSNRNLESGLLKVSEQAGQPVTLANLTHILITHAHIDHFGGLSYVHERTQAKLGVHELDRRILTNYEERLTIVGRRLDDFLAEAGLTPERRAQVLEMYKMTKSLYHSVKVDFTYEAIGMRLGPLEMLHVPGHCAGHVVIRAHDILLSGDHVLEHTSPHQSPERLTLSTGLDHYLHSLEVLRAWATGIHLTLGGHEEPITNLPDRIDAIRDLHQQRLDKVLGLLAEPHTISEVSKGLFGELKGYNVLLGLEETGAHVEYLYQRGLLGIENLADLEASTGPVPIRYYRLSEGA